MPLINMKTLLTNAEVNNYAVGSFSIANMEMVMGAIKAAEELNSPIILQIAESRLNYSPLDLIGPLMIEAATKASVPIAVHFDHGTTIKQIRRALYLGFTSVMIDGSSLPLEENIEITNRVKAIARLYQSDIEAEIGHVGGSEDGSKDINIKYTQLEEAKEFLNKTQVDALAVAIGNAHGNYKENPKIRFDILEELSRNLNVSLVLHGSSGIDENDLKKAINLGIRKINIATDTFNSVQEKLQTIIKEKENYDYFTLHRASVQGAYENVKRYIKIFGSENRAYGGSLQWHTLNLMRQGNLI